MNGQSENEEHYNNWFDSIIGIENTGLYNGVEYIPKYRVINDNHQYFLSEKFLKASLNYNGQFYADASIKYDIYQDVVLLKVQKGLGKGTIKTIRNKLTEFFIENKKFVNLKISNETIEINGFHEVLSDLKFLTLYKKYVLRNAKISNQGKFHYEFVEGKNKYYFKFKNKYYEISRKKDLVNIFPQYRKQIINYHEKKSSKLDKDSSLKLLITRVNQLYIDTETQMQE